MQRSEVGKENRVILCNKDFRSGRYFAEIKSSPFTPILLFLPGMQISALDRAAITVQWTE
jgi:hypothetical protein